MGIDTRMKGREPVSGTIQLLISDSIAAMIKLNVPRDKGGSTTVVNAQLVDINAYGCGAEVPYLIPAGVELNVNIEAAPFARETGITRKEPITASCKVAVCVMKTAGSYKLGLSFVNIPPADKAVIEDFIKARESRNNPG